MDTYEKIYEQPTLDKVMDHIAIAHEELIEAKQIAESASDEEYESNEELYMELERILKIVNSFRSKAINILGNFK